MLVDDIGACAPCSCSPTEAYCNARGLTDIPEGLPTTISHLRLQQNNIMSLNMTRLEKLYALTELNLGTNLLTNFQLKSGQLPMLNKLHLDYNNDLEQLFINSTSLQYLYLDGTALTCLSNQNIQTENLLYLYVEYTTTFEVLDMTHLTKLNRLWLDRTSVREIYFNNSALRIDYLRMSYMKCDCCMLAFLQSADDEYLCYKPTPSCEDFDLSSCAGNNTVCPSK